MTKKDQIKAILENFHGDPVDITALCTSGGLDDGYFRLVAKGFGYRISTRVRSQTMLVGVERLTE